jgi:hypothetical protein
VTTTEVLAGLGSVAGALILAALALYWRRLPLLRGYQPNASLAAAARRFQSGVVNDYVTWAVIGLACLGGIFAWVIGLPGGRAGHDGSWPRNETGRPAHWEVVNPGFHSAWEERHGYRPFHDRRR